LDGETLMSKKNGSDSYPASFESVYVEKGSRLELLVRIVYSLILGLIAYFWSFIVGFTIIIQWFHVLITGKRNEKLWRFKASFFRFYTRMFAYYSLMTDVRPPITGRSIPLPEYSRTLEIFCISCGAPNQEGKLYCTKCGAKQK
jgi:hypothetical protein